MAYNAKDIAVSEGLDSVRKRPGMYIGSTSAKVLSNLICEIPDNSVDEYLAGCCSNITVSINKDGSATVVGDENSFAFNENPHQLAKIDSEKRALKGKKMQ